MNFEFATATRIVFGAGAVRQLGELARPLGARALVVIGRSPQRVQPILDLLTHSRISHSVFSIAAEPTFERVREGLQQAKKYECDLVIGVGGGSALDAGKAISMLLANGGDPLDYAEVIGSGRPIVHPSIPFVAVPTTSGTGSEVTRNAVLGSDEHRVKVSLRSPLMLPQLALVDPELTITLPPAETAATGMDALSQLIEPFVSDRANPMTDAVCREGILRAARSLQRAVEQGNDPAARLDMALASLFSGMALANAGLGAVHGFAAPVGGMFPAPHGATCAALLAPVMELNVRALRERALEHEALHRYREVARILSGDPLADIETGIVRVAQLAKVLKIPPLRHYGIQEKDFPVLAEKAIATNSMKGNPISLTAGELREVLEKSW